MGPNAPNSAPKKMKFGVEESTFDGVKFHPIGGARRPYGVKNVKIALVNRHLRCATRMLELFSSPSACTQSYSPTKLGMIIGEVRIILAPPKGIRIPRTVSPLGALKIWGKHTLEV